MNLTNLSHAYLILLICILNEIYGTRIPLEIVQLESDARISDDKIIANEYQIHETDHESSKQNRTDRDDWRNRANRKLTTTIQEPRILYQVGVSFFSSFN